MKRYFYSSLLVVSILLFCGCVTVNNHKTVEVTLSPDMATGTAEVARKYTQAAQLTMYPMTAAPTEPVVIDTLPWTPMPGEIVARDSGESFDFWMTSRFSIILKQSDYPITSLELICNPEVVLGRISNIEPVPSDYYVIRYEGVASGQCLIRNGLFEVTINIVNHP